MISNPRTATFLFTDLENGTPLWEQHPKLMQALASRHDTLLRAVIEAHRGRVVKSTGDGFHAVFDSAADGAAAALAACKHNLPGSCPASSGRWKRRRAKPCATGTPNTSPPSSSRPAPTCAGPT